jgi:hypothetical protein
LGNRPRGESIRVVGAASAVSLVERSQSHGVSHALGLRRGSDGINPQEGRLGAAEPSPRKRPWARICPTDPALKRARPGLAGRRSKRGSPPCTAVRGFAPGPRPSSRRGARTNSRDHAERRRGRSQKGRRGIRARLTTIRMASRSISGPLPRQPGDPAFCGLYPVVRACVEGSRSPNRTTLRRWGMWVRRTVRASFGGTRPPSPSTRGGGPVDRPCRAPWSPGPSFPGSRPPPRHGTGSPRGTWRGQRGWPRASA